MLLAPTAAFTDLSFDALAAGERRGVQRKWGRERVWVQVTWSRRSWYLVAIMCALLAVSMLLMVREIGRDGRKGCEE